MGFPESFILPAQPGLAYRHHTLALTPVLTLALTLSLTLALAVT